MNTKRYTISLHKNFRKVRLKRKTNQENKQANKQTKQTINNTKKTWYPPNPTRFSEIFVANSLPVSTFKICFSKHHLCYGTMSFITCHFLVKAIVFFELIKAISLSILLTFRISAMRLFIFTSFSSLDLYTFNLNINRIKKRENGSLWS